MPREGSIYVESRTLWLLGRIVKAHNATLKEQDVPLTTDGLADDILLEWIKKTKPKLVDLWDRRKQIDEEALTL